MNRLLKGDEFKITPERRRATDEFMSWLRDNAQRHQGKVRIVLSGSIGLESILQQARLSATINSFEAFELKPWDSETATACLRALSNEYGIEFESGAAERMVAMLGCCIPHHVQMFFSYVRDWCKRQNVRSASVAEVERIYKEEMLGVRGHAELTHYEERLKLVLGDDSFTLALDILTETAHTRSLTPVALKAFEGQYSFKERSTADVQKEILRVLEHDGYLRRREDGYTFVSLLVRDWWKARHGFGYVPVEERKD